MTHNGDKTEQFQGDCKGGLGFTTKSGGVWNFPKPRMAMTFIKLPCSNLTSGKTTVNRISIQSKNTLPSEGLFYPETTMPRYWATIEITRSAFAEIEAENAEEAHEKVIELLEEGEIQGWEEDVPQIRLEELPEEDA